MVKKWFSRLWAWLRGKFSRTPTASLAGKPFKYAQILKSSRVENSVFVDSGLPSCLHTRRAPAGIPPELYSELGIDPYSVAGYFMNSGDLYAQCQDCQHERVYPKEWLFLFENSVVKDDVAKRYGRDTFDRRLYQALKAGRIGSSTPIYDSVFPR